MAQMRNIEVFRQGIWIVMSFLRGSFIKSVGKIFVEAIKRVG